MHGTAKDGSHKQFTPDDARFAEYKNHGPGAVINAKRPQLSDEQAKLYQAKLIFDGWTPFSYTFNN